MVSQGIPLPIGYTDDKLIPHMPAAWFVGWYCHVLFEIILGKEFHIAGGIRLSGSCPSIEVREFHSQHSRLNRVEAAIDANDLMVVARLHAVDSQQLQRRSNIISRGREESAITDAAQILCRIKAEAANIA